MNESKWIHGTNRVCAKEVEGNVRFKAVIWIRQYGQYGQCFKGKKFRNGHGGGYGRRQGGILVQRRSKRKPNGRNWRV